MKDTPAEIRALFEQNATAIAALIEDPNVLQEPWRGHLLELKGRLDASLAAMKPTDQIPAAQQASWGLDQVRYAMLSIQAMIDNLKGVTKSYNDKISTATASLPTKIEEGINAKLASGDYLKKADAQALAETAKADGEKAGLAKGKLLSDRRMALATAGLPVEVIATAPEAILLGEEAAFNAARDAAKDRFTKLTGLGLSTASAAQLPWEKEEVFTAQFTVFEEIAKGKGTANASANQPTKDKQKAGGINPMAAGADASGQAKEPEKVIMPMF